MSKQYTVAEVGRRHPEVLDAVVRSLQDNHDHIVYWFETLEPEAHPSERELTQLAVGALLDELADEEPLMGNWKLKLEELRARGGE